MLKNLSVPGRAVEENLPCIKVIGVGGAGGNAIDNMLAAGMSGVDFLICNTDAQALLKSRCEHRLQLGEELTQGMGAGCSPALGEQAAEESSDEIRAYLQGAQMVFLAAGMGGGTGTGAGPVIAKLAKELGILTVAVITTPFAFEGKQRRQVAEQGVAQLEAIADTLSVINNQNLFCISSDSTSMQEAFETADEVLASSVRSITDLVTRPGIINRDFADVRSVMERGGRALISTVETEGDDRAERAAEAVVLNPLLEKVDIATARKLLIHVVGSEDLKLFEVQEIVDRIGDSVEGEPSVAFGYSKDEALTGRLRVSVVATGIENPDTATRNLDDNAEDAHFAAQNGKAADKAAMWYDTHQRSRRREPEGQEETTAAQDDETTQTTPRAATASKEATRGAKGNGAANATAPSASNTAANTASGMSAGDSAFRSALLDSMTPTTKVAEASATTASSSGVRSVRTRPYVNAAASRESERDLEAGTNASKSNGKGNDKGNSNGTGNSNGKLERNVGVAQSVLDALKGFMGLRGPEISSARPLYLPREGGETGSLPLESISEVAATNHGHGQGHGHSEDTPVGLPAFLQRPKD